MIDLDKSKLTMIVFGLIALLISILVYQIYIVQNVIYELNELKVLYQDRIAICDDLITQTQFESIDQESVNQINDQVLLLTRGIDYLVDHAYEYYKSEKLEHVWQACLREYKKVAAQSLQKKPIVQVKHKGSHIKGINQKKCKSNAFLQWPIQHDMFWLSSRFGKRKYADGSTGFHHGIDLAALKGTPVYAAADGVVIDTLFTQGYGKLVIIKHTSRITTRYAHLSAILVKKGSTIKRGDLIGRVGDTGFIRKKTNDGSHLHFEVSDNGKRINPLLVLP